MQTADLKDRLVKPTASSNPNFVSAEDDPWEWYEVTNLEFGTKVPVVVSWDGRKLNIRAHLPYYQDGSRQRRWSLQSDKKHFIPRSLAEYLNSLVVPDPLTEINTDTGIVKVVDANHMRKRVSCVFLRDYKPSDQDENHQKKGA